MISVLQLLNHYRNNCIPNQIVGIEDNQAHRYERNYLFIVINVYIHALDVVVVSVLVCSSCTTSHDNLVPAFPLEVPAPGPHQPAKDHKEHLKWWVFCPDPGIKDDRSSPAVSLEY